MKIIKNLFILLGVFFCFLLVSCDNGVYTVTFKNENGEYIRSVEVNSGSKISEPTSVQEYEGYTFVGWYLDGKVFSFDTKIENNISLIAKYEANRYTLSFGNGVPPMEVAYGKPVGQLPTVPNQGGKENGVWMLDGIILTSTTIYNYTEDKEAVADYSEKYYAVSFLEVEETKQHVTYGSKAIEPRTPKKDGYDFAGWYLDGVRFDFNTPIKEDITLQPHWLPRNDTSYNVNVFVEVDDEYIDISSEYASLLTGLTATTEAVVNINEIAQQTIPTNYVLNTEKSTLEGVVVGDGSLVLKVYCDVVRYTIDFDFEGVEDQIVKVGYTATRPTRPEKDGYVFHSWLLGEEEYDFSTKVTSDVTLTPHWLEVKDHVVTFESLHETEIKSQSLSDGEKISTPRGLEKVGYEFDGWYFENVKWDFDTTLTSTHSQNINLVAKWVACEYELSFDENGVDSIVVTYGEPIGQLPQLSYLASNKVGNWSIDGKEINAETIWMFDENKQANSMYFVDMLSQTLDLSTKGESDLAEQLLKVLGLSEGNVEKITENGVEITSTYLSDIETNATDENSRRKTLVVNIGNTEYKLNVFFATKVIYTYEELTKIQEYGGVTEKDFPAVTTYKMYAYSGHFILGNDIDASASMTKPFNIKSIGTYNSQNWDYEMEGFVGVFDGRGHTISNLHTGGSGLLGDVMEGSVIKNLAITNAQVVAQKYAGAGVLCFIFSRASIENVYVEFTTQINNSGIFGRMNTAGSIRNVVVKYTNTREPVENDKYTVGVLSSWQVKTTYVPYPVFENVSIIYGYGTHVSNMQAIGNSTYTNAGIKEYILQADGSLKTVKSKAAGDKEFTSYTTGSLSGSEFVNYDETYWDLSGAYPVFK